MEMDAAKLIGAGLAVIALAGVGVGIGNIFASLVTAVGRNPAAKNEVFGIAISIVVLPVLSEHFQKNELNKYSQTLTRSIKLATLIALPAMIGLIVLSASIISS